MCTWIVLTENTYQTSEDGTMTVSYPALDCQQRDAALLPSRPSAQPRCCACCSHALGSTGKSDHPDHHRRIQGTATSLKTL